MKHYTSAKARKEIGKSISWRDARKVSIKKWKEIIEYGERFYFMGEECGYCFVEDNRVRKELTPEKMGCKRYCPAAEICSSIGNSLPTVILEKLKKLKR